MGASTGMNPLAAGVPGPSSAPAGNPAGNPLGLAAPDHGPMLGALGADHDMAAARYGKLKEADARLGAVRRALDGLVKLGDMVSQEDVVKASGELVGAGMAAGAVAGLLSDMPPSGEALQAWIAQQDQQVQQRERQLGVVTGLARHQMGLTALRMLTGHAIAAGAGVQMPSSQPASAAPLAPAPEPDNMEPGNGS